MCFWAPATGHGERGRKRFKQSCSQERSSAGRICHYKEKQTRRGRWSSCTVDGKALPGEGQSHLLIQDVLRDLQGRPGLRVVDDCDGGSGPGQQLEEKVVHERQCHGGGVVRLVVE